MDLVHKKRIRLKQIFVVSLSRRLSGAHQRHSRWLLTASLSPEPTRSAPHGHSGHREAEFISRIRLAGGSRTVHWSVSRSTFPVPSSCPRGSDMQPKRLAAEVRVLTRELSPRQTINKPVVWEMKDLQLRQLCANALGRPDGSAA